MTIMVPANIRHYPVLMWGYPGMQGYPLIYLAAFYAVNDNTSDKRGYPLMYTAVLTHCKHLPKPQAPSISLSHWYAGFSTLNNFLGAVSGKMIGDSILFGELFADVMGLLIVVDTVRICVLLLIADS